MEHPRETDSLDPYTVVGELQYILHPEVIPNVDDLVIEDGKPVESILAEKQYRLLTEPLYVSWKAPSGRPFLAVSNVGLFFAFKQPPLVPDVMLSLNVPGENDLANKENRSYFLWVIGKPPEVVIEIVSDRRGGEDSQKMDRYAEIGVKYYAIFDPFDHLHEGILRVFRLSGAVYQIIEPSWLPGVGLGLTLWEGEFEGKSARWLRWCDREGALILTGGERAEQERQRAEQADQRAEQERQRAKQERQRAEQESQYAEQERQRAEQERQRAEQERQRAEQERQRAERLAALLRAQGIDPEA